MTDQGVNPQERAREVIARADYEGSYESGRGLLPGPWSALDPVHKSQHWNVADFFLSALSDAGLVVVPREALLDLLDVADDMRGYVPPFFAEKREYDEQLASTRAALGLVEVPEEAGEGTR